MLEDFQEDNEENIMKTVSSKSFSLSEMQELRIDVDLSQDYEIELMKGTAEIFGTEIAPQHSYRFSGKRISIFSWRGAEIKVTYPLPKPIIITKSASASSKPEEDEPEFDAYVGEKTPMPDYLMIHEKLRKIRQEKKNLLKTYINSSTQLIATSLNPQNTNISFSSDIIQSTQGPRVLLVGDFDTGKSTVAKILTNYACRNGDPVIYIDLDPELQEVSLPGTIAAVKVGIKSAKAGPDGKGEGGIEPLHPVHEFNTYSPLVHFFGRFYPSENVYLYKEKMKQLFEAVEQKLANDHSVRTGGVIIKTNGWFAENKNKDALQTLFHIIDSFKISHVFVLDNEKLTKDLTNGLKKLSITQKIEIDNLKKSSGCLKRNKEMRDNLKMLKYRTYLKGVQIPLPFSNNPQVVSSSEQSHSLTNELMNPSLSGSSASKRKDTLTPHSVVAGFREVELCEIGEPMKAPEGTLPIGEVDTQTKEYDVGVVDIDEREANSLGSCMLAVSFAEKFEDVLESNIMGFVFVQKVDLEKKQLNLLCPIPGKLMKKYLLRGVHDSMKWIDV